ncbi:hypothetical protein NUW54_g5583 [Trametes sanguinea]|uniref:Uncharacterized protein n=1 Tax=Trametes sanguinea TaxID=158606 RepID=A0ACC1PWS8_9APHY|nr:hypothetical protein NUW54_g5583 [Trametes sanguinea]
MGNELSAPYDGPPEVLEARDLPSIAKYMKSPECRRVFVMLGAGVSTAAGIPDFRSPGTGLYSNLQRLNLPYPEAVFEINYFRENPVPFYTLARELYPGQFRPTLTHTFVKLLADHTLLDTCFTQNIDTLERQAGVPGDKIVEAHGSFASQHCIECHASVDGAKMRRAVEAGDIIRCADCGGLVKPDIVFFGESLPPAFHKTVPRLRSANLLIVIGTSLTVHPFASLTTLVPDGCPRVLINMDPAGDIGTRPDDVVLLGRCDEIIRDLCRELGWEQELDREWAKTEVLKPLDELADITLRGLAEIHSAYVMHCDVHSRNILVAPGNRVVWVDFNCSCTPASPHYYDRELLQGELALCWSFLYYGLLPDKRVGLHMEGPPSADAMDSQSPSVWSSDYSE